MSAEIEIAPERARELMASGAAQVVDVREPYEYEAGHIAGARHIELARLQAEAQTLDPARPIIFYCRVGARSGMAADAFRASGREAYNMAGGLVNWVDRSLPLEPEDGTVAAHGG